MSDLAKDAFMEEQRKRLEVQEQLLHEKDKEIIRLDAENRTLESQIDELTATTAVSRKVEIQILLDSLDEYARAYDKYEMGLPLQLEHLDNMIKIVDDWLLEHGYNKDNIKE